SIAIPTYNRANLLSKTLESVWQQISGLADQIEIIVSNNASTDHTREVVEQYSAKFQHFRYCENETNTGADANIAQAFRLSTGTYAWVLSDDDLLLPGTLANIVAILGGSELGMLFLTPKWYYSHVEDVVLATEPFNCQLYSDPLAYLQKINVLIAFISATIINKDLVAKLDSLYTYQGTNLIQVGWALPAIFKAQQNAIVTSEVILAQGVDQHVSYGFFRVHGTNFNKVLSGLVASGHVPNKAREIITHSLITQFFPIYIQPARQFVNNERPFSTLFQLYWQKRVFWSKLMPIFVRRLYVPTFAKINSGLKSLFVKGFNKLNAISSREQASKTSARLHRFGTHSQLPTMYVLQNPQHIAIGRRFRALNGLHLNAVLAQASEQFVPSITIGDDVSLGANCHISCVQQVTIGNHVLIADNVCIADNCLDESPTALRLPPSQRRLLSRGAVVLRDNVLIEAGAHIMSGVTIGENAIVRANAVVYDDVAPYTVVAGR
ncbi:MAG: glycosyltransferase, partial [Hymenobacter sp.]